MSLKIDSDVGRFKDIIKGKARKEIRKFMSNGSMTGFQGKKTVKIPIPNINLPHFTFGGKNGGTAQGDGEIGDGVGKGKGKGKGGKEAGDGAGENDFNAEFTREELANLIKEELNLPNLEQKGKDSLKTEKHRYNKITNVGSNSLRHMKRTLKQTLIRQISSGEYNPDDPVLVPIKQDFRYKTYSTKTIPEVSACAFYLADCSGSMGEREKQLMKLTIFWIDLLLSTTYDKMDSVFVVHTSDAQEVSKEDFFKINESGGTIISSAFEKCCEIIDERYPFASVNNYVFYFGDSENMGNDNEHAALNLRDKLIPNCNQFAYGHISPDLVGEGIADFGGNFNKVVEANFKEDPKVVMANITKNDDIMDTIKKFFERGH